MTIRTSLVLLIASALSPIGSTAQPATQPATQPRQLTLHAAAMFKPALKSRLMPDPIDITPGNAATLYLMACSHNLMAAKDTVGQQLPLDDWLTMPPARIPRADADRLINEFHGALREIELAARRQDCHWDLPSHTEGFATLLPYLSDMRYLGKVLALEARLEIGDGRFADAAHTIQTGLAMAHHLKQEAFIIQMLVGASIGQMMLDQVELWVQTPGAPNLYWPLTDLPQPFFDNREAMRSERTSVSFSIPHWKEAGEGKLTAEHLQEMLSMLAAVTAEEGKPKRGLEALAAMIARAAQDTPAARGFLHNAGYSDQALEAMQPPQILGLYYVRSYDNWIQEMTKWFDLPYPQARAGLDGVERELQKQRATYPGNLMYRLLPALGRAGMTAVQFERRIGELRCLEAVRAYAAAHDGKAPPDLQNLPESPAPLDPVTGTAFGYDARGDGFTLDAPIPTGGKAQDGRRYEVRIEK